MTPEEISRAWRSEVVSVLRWQAAAAQPDVGTGDLQGFAVVADGFPGRGFLKPGVRLHGAERKHHAAREKIAADLAFDLSLPVPPAVLWRREEPSMHVEPRVVVSAFVYPEDVKWFMVEYGNVRPVDLSDAEVAETLRRASGMLAFDTWVDQHEHAPHAPGNIVWGFNRESRESGISFLDYASAFGSDGSWHGKGWSSIAVPKMQPLLHRHLDPARLADVVGSIEATDDVRIREIVDRVPDDFLPSSEKAMLEVALLGRRSLIRMALGEYLAAGKP